ncbi:leucyl aminopeptidase [Oleispirillum naphthae]|uniref:leucyl aminopeptidase n=1 Tax=Oleispirillum naphthae TaxID=2838853 RepID=UPI0030823044
MKVTFAKPGLPKAGCLAVGVLETGILTPSAQTVDEACGGALTRAIAAARFSGKAEQTLSVVAPAGVSADCIVLIGLGKAEGIDARRMESFGAAAQAAAEKARAAELTISVDAIAKTKASAAMLAAHAALGAALASYRFDLYRTRQKPEDKPSVSDLTVRLDDFAAAKTAFLPMSAVADGVGLTRDLVSEPANVLSPELFAKVAKGLEKDGVEVTVLGEKEMAKLGMGALLGVGQGSERDSQLVVLRWQGGEKDEPPVAIVGKGVCFDSGGISIKPAANMEEMKTDMSGAAVTTGLLQILARRKARVNVVGILGLVENMPSGAAQRPGDVVTSMSGQTIEVINTDAEGRLVLADALWYVQETFHPKAVIDLATLTGACVIALGSEHAGLFSNDDALAAALAAAGAEVGEPLWRLPLGEAYDKQIDSDIADMKNTGGREAGAITAAQFLQRFVREGTAWAHLDIAGVAWTKKAKGTVPKGASGFGVRLLERLIAAAYEAAPAPKAPARKARK